MSDEIQQLKEEIAALRRTIDETDDWASGFFLVLVQVLPFLLRNHPEIDKIHGVMKEAHDLYGELLAHPERDTEGVPAARYEAVKMLYQQLALLGVWPNVDPKDVVKATTRH